MLKTADGKAATSERSQAWTFSPATRAARAALSRAVRRDLERSENEASSPFSASFEECWIVKNALGLVNCRSQPSVVLTRPSPT
jgi:hypothetical protein